MFFAYFSEPCTVINSDSSLIVDIEESRGNQVTQDIIPTELEISGTYILIMILQVIPKEIILIQYHRNNK